MDFFSNEAFISSVVIILLFVTERVISYSTKGKDKKNEWYLNVIVYPHLERIKKFFSDIELQTIKSKEEINTAIVSDVLSKTTKSKVSNQNKIKEIKRKFNFEFINLVLTYDSDLSAKLRETLNELEDYLIKFCDNDTIIDNVINSKIVELEEVIEAAQNKFFLILFEEIKSQYSQKFGWKYLYLVALILIMSGAFYFGYRIGNKSDIDTNADRTKVDKEGLDRTFTNEVETHNDSIYPTNEVEIHKDSVQPTDK